MNFSRTKKSVEKCLRVGLVPFVQSSPGIGKSAMAKELAKEFHLKLIDYRISSADPTDFNGYPNIDKASGTASYVPFDTFPVDTTPLPPTGRMEEDPAKPGTHRLVMVPNPDKAAAATVPMVPEYYAGWLLLMDELNHGNPSILRAAYKLILDKKIGQRNLHPRVTIMAAGNLATDNAMTNKLGSALDSRVIQYFLETDYKEWLIYAGTANVDYRITSWIGFEPKELNTFDSNTPPGPFACQRTWEFASRLIHDIPVLDHTHIELLSGAVGEGAARKFVQYTKVFQDLPTIDDIIRSPSTAKIPNSADCIWAVTGLLANNASLQNARAILQYAQRLPTEFTVITIQDAMRRNPDLVNDDSIDDWINANLNSIVD